MVADGGNPVNVVLALRLGSGGNPVNVVLALRPGAVNVILE